MLAGGCRTLRLPHEGEGSQPSHSPPAEPAAGHRSINSPGPRAAMGQAQGLGRSSRTGKHPKDGPETHLGKSWPALSGDEHMESTKPPG